MSIRRAPRPQSNFYMLDKQISEDRRLTWAARGLLVFLLGKPDHWEISVKNLINETAGSVKQSGRDAVYGLLRELEKAGYLQRSQGRGQGGSFGSADYIVHETPHTDYPETVEPQPDSPDTEKPCTGQPYTANPTQVSIEGLVSNETPARTDHEQSAPGDEPTGDLVESDPRASIDADNEPRVAIPPDMPGPKDPKAKTFKPWANYAVAYRQRYGVYPIWNARTAGQMGQLVDRVGVHNAPGVAAYYLRMNNQFYVAKGHTVGLMLQDCETIAMQMQTGQQMTATRARQMDGTQANASAADEAKRLLGDAWEG
ncbi:hypothetical protein [Halomonas caseinilytica]|uniref:hypothetical protein n=1 Tax=Halomonas caseinilytica TaxID=438744 RepID=UPI0007E538AA|nr:hypothetical protein [Halomonas caseinilytica]SEN67693.1 hypothetical protein SAMN04487952_1245 [Halomonas caseinilytica]